MAAQKKKTPQFFEDDFLDPVEAATGTARTAHAAPGDKPPKKKAGFYISVTLLDRFNRKYHELNLTGPAIENKSALLEAALKFALDDMDKKESSLVLRNFSKPG